MAQMQLGEAPDGYSLLYYKNFGDHLIPHVLSAYNTIGEGIALPGDALRVYIAVIPKGGKYTLHCQNYRPIFLLNVELKIFTKILFLCLMDLIPFRPIRVCPYEGGM